MYSNRPLDTPCIPVNSYDGRRVYVALHEEEVSEVTVRLHYPDLSPFRRGTSDLCFWSGGYRTR